jgi:hypothetical protein
MPDHVDELQAAVGDDYAMMFRWISLTPTQKRMNSLNSTPTYVADDRGAKTCDTDDDDRCLLF